MFLLLPTDSCPHGDHADEPAPRPGGWQARLARCVQQLAVYLGDAYLAAEGCRGDAMCFTADFYSDATDESAAGVDSTRSGLP